MLTSGKLRQIVAEALGLQDQLESVDVHLRNLREAGLVAKAKKGRGAAEMGLEDAVNLLIAVAGSERVKDSVRAVERYASLQANSLRLSKERSTRDPVPTHLLPGLGRPQTFSEGLEVLMIGLREGNVFTSELRRSYWPGAGDWDRPRPSEYVFVRFFFPFDLATIQYGIRRKFEVRVAYGSPPLRPNLKSEWDLRDLRSDGRLVTLRIVDAQSLTMIANAIV